MKNPYHTNVVLIQLLLHECSAVKILKKFLLHEFNVIKVLMKRLLQECSVCCESFII